MYERTVGTTTAPKTFTAANAVVKHRLANGARVIVDHEPAFRSASVVVCLLGGSRDDAPQFIGLTHLLEHLLFKQTKSRTTQAIATTIDDFGGRINAITDVDSLCLYGAVPAARALELLRFFAELLLESNCSETDLQLEREVVRQEILEAEDDHFTSIFRAFHERFWPTSTVGMPVFGYTESLERMTLSDVRARLKELLCGARMIVSISGNVPPEAVTAEVERLFGALPAGQGPEIKAPERGSGVGIVEKPISQCHLILGQAWMPLRDEDHIAGTVFASVVGEGMSSRLFRLLREEHGLAYDVSSDIDSYVDTGALLLTATVERRNFEVTQKLLLAELKRLKQDLISSEELARAVRMISAQLEMQADDVHGRAWRALETEIVFGRYVSVDEVAGKLARLQLEDIQRVVDRWLLSSPALLIAGGDVHSSLLDGELTSLCAVRN